MMKRICDMTDEEFCILTNEDVKEWERLKAIGTVEELQALKEKSVAKSPERKYVKCGKHKWKRRENGEVEGLGL